MFEKRDLVIRYPKSWDAAVPFFEGEKGESIDLIVAAQERGLSRPSARHDIFVHPQFPFHLANVQGKSTAAYMRERAEYAKLVHAAIDAAADPIFISYANGKIEWPDLEIPFDREISSAFNDGMIAGGIASSSLGKFLELLDGINPDDEFRIHGAAFASCPRELALQLYGIIYAASFWPSIQPDHRTKWNPDYIAFANGEYILTDNSVLENSGIRLGVLHDMFGVVGKHLAPAPHLKSLSMQMVDEESAIVPYEKGKAHELMTSTGYCPPSA